MPGYIKAALHKYQHPAPTRPEHTASPALSPKDVNCIQKLGGTLIYYARAVDPMIIMPVNVLDSEQTRATAATA
jgi:hypothetical protein